VEFPQYAFMVWCSDKARGQLYLYLYYRYYTKEHNFDSFLLYCVDVEVRMGFIIKKVRETVLFAWYKLLF